MGHIACYCPCIRCLDCNDYGYVAADCPNKILPSGIPARHRDNTRRCDRSTSQDNHHNKHHHCDHQDRYRLSRSRSHSHNPRYRSNSCSDSCRGHSGIISPTLTPQHIMPQKLKHIPLPMRHPTQQVLIMQEFLQRQQ